jgi:hypothetical protein
MQFGGRVFSLQHHFGSRSYSLCPQPTFVRNIASTRGRPIPGTRLYAVASVFYTDESMRVAEHYDSISPQLSISGRARHDPLKSLHNAEAEVMYTTPYAARVYTPFKVRGRPKLLVLECRREAKD